MKKPPRNPIGRRLGKGLCLLLGVLLIVPGCGLDTPPRTKIRFWNGFTGPDGRTMLKLVKQFNQENPDVQVLMQRMDWATYYNKIFVAGLGGRAPEVFVIHADYMERFLQADFLRPVDDLMRGPLGLDESDFVEGAWKAVESEGKHYAVPLDIHNLGLYYNNALFREAGIVDDQGRPRPPANREQFLDAVARLTRDLNGDGATDQWGYIFTWFRTNFLTVLHQWEGECFTPDKKTCILNSPENVEALQFCVDLIWKYRVSPSPENFDAWIGFRQGKVGMAFEGIYMIADLERQKDLDFSGAPLPVLGKQPAAWANSHTLCLSKGLQGEQLDAAWRFVRFLSENSLDWAVGGQIPVRKSLLETERFQAMKVQSEFARQIPYLRFAPRIPFIAEFLTEVDAAVEKALRGSASPQQALDEATENTNRIIRRHEAALEEVER